MPGCIVIIILYIVMAQACCCLLAQDIHVILINLMDMKRNITTVTSFTLFISAIWTKGCMSQKEIFSYCSWKMSIFSHNSFW